VTKQQFTEGQIEALENAEKRVRAKRALRIASSIAAASAVGLFGYWVWLTTVTYP
jgi:hypothetical protein